MTQTTDSTTAEKLAMAIQVLKEIHEASRVTGRWLAVFSGEEAGIDRASPDEGYYDRKSPPDGYTEDGYYGEEPQPQPHLLPAYWADFTYEEQEGWIQTCAAMSRDALLALGQEVT